MLNANSNENSSLSVANRFHFFFRDHGIKFPQLDPMLDQAPQFYSAFSRQVGTGLMSVFLFFLNQSMVAGEFESFEKNIKPLLQERCVKCHGPEKQKGGLRLDSRAELLRGGDDGLVI